MENEKIHKKLLKLLEDALMFRLSQETLINSAVDEYQRRLYGSKERDKEFYNISRISKESIMHIHQLSFSFSEEIQNFRKLLADADKSHLRFLAFRLDFNEFYSNHITSRKSFI